MLTIIEPYILSFIPIFIAAGTLGNIPYFISLTQDLSKEDKKKVIRESVIVSTGLAVLFLFVGKFILNVLGVTVSDFKIAGGLLLMFLSIYLLSPAGANRPLPSRDVGIFPLGTPLITGPAVLTMTLIMSNVYGLVPTLVSLLLNMFLAGITFIFSGFILKFLGAGMVRAFSKIADILLAAIAVMMIRSGVIDYVVLLMGR